MVAIQTRGLYVNHRGDFQNILIQSSVAFKTLPIAIWPLNRRRWAGGEPSATPRATGRHTEEQRRHREGDRARASGGWRRQCRWRGGHSLAPEFVNRVTR
jgi:hypothetical protein